MEEKKVSNEKISEKLGIVIDDVIKTVKKASRDIFDLMVEITADTANEVVDKKVDCIKQKIKEKEEKIEKTNS